VQRAFVRDCRRSAAFVHDGGPLTENVRLAFPAPDNASVAEFRRVALAAGHHDNGGPGERCYRGGYYSAFVLDPGGPGCIAAKG